ncbi:MAG: DUF2513 domain-containing protein [Deinococcota bacterium]
MKRHLDLLRDILLRLEQHPTYTVSGITMDGTLLDFANYSAEVTSYHLNLLVEVGWLRLQSAPFEDAGSIVVRAQLSWHGHEFLALARDARRWQEALAQLGTTDNVTLLEMVLLELAKQYLAHKEA